jgi:phosphomethylpyrimidine synthase
MGVVESVKTAADLFSPVSGKVRETNISLKDNPQFINQDPYGKGWILKMDLRDKEELKKLEVSIQAGTDTVMDLSTGGDIDAIRKEIIRHSPIPVGTVPIYEAAIEAVKKRKALAKMRVEDLFEVIERQAEEGVDFITVHCGVTQNAVERLKAAHRLLGVVSRGGSFLVEWMIYNRQENPLYEHYDRTLKNFKKV